MASLKVLTSCTPTLRASVSLITASLLPPILTRAWSACAIGSSKSPVSSGLKLVCAFSVPAAGLAVAGLALLSSSFFSLGLAVVGLFLTSSF